MTTHDDVAAGFSATATDYESAVRHNIHGASRLIGSLPARDYRRSIDIGCGTGWASVALLDRFPVAHITGVDPSEGMLEQFKAKLADHPETDFRLLPADVMAMPVADDEFDLAISTMAFHWFPDKPGAIRQVARVMAPDGIFAMLASGRRGEHAFRAVLAGLDPPAPASWDAAFDDVQRDEGEVEEYLLAAGLEPLDIWMESRIRHTTPEAYMERMRVVAGHITADMDPEHREDLNDRIMAAMRAASGPRGFEYVFTKLYALARKPG